MNDITAWPSKDWHRTIFGDRSVIGLRSPRPRLEALGEPRPPRPTPAPDTRQARRCPAGRCCWIGGRRRRCRAGRLRHRRPRHGDDRRSPRPAADRSATDKDVNWANWTLYLDYDEKRQEIPDAGGVPEKTGIKATYAEDIDDNDTYYGKIQGQLHTGQDIGKDVIVFTDWMAGRSSGRVRAEAGPGGDPEREEPAARAQDVDFDPGRKYSLPWQGVFGVLG